MCKKNDDVEDTLPKDWLPVKEPSKKKKRSKKKTKICKTCHQNILENEIRGTFMYKDTYHQLQVKDYCKEHEAIHSNHKCKPHWCGDCDYLINYTISIVFDNK